MTLVEMSSNIVVLVICKVKFLQRCFPLSDRRFMRTRREEGLHAHPELFQDVVLFLPALYYIRAELLILNQFFFDGILEHPWLDLHPLFDAGSLFDNPWLNVVYLRASPCATNELLSRARQVV